MKKTILLVILFTVSWLFFIVCLMPAHIALSAAKPYLPKQLQIGDVSGTLWQGRVSELAYQGTYIQGANWQLSGGGLLLGQAKLAVTFGDAKQAQLLSGKSDINYGLFNAELTLSNTLLRAPLQTVISQLQLPLPINVKGRLLADIPLYQLGAPYCELLQGDLMTQNVSVQGTSGWFSLDAILGEVSCQEGGVALKIEPDNELGLELNALLSGPNQLTATGFVKPAESVPRDVHNAVKFLGRADAQGRYTLRF